MKGYIEIKTTEGLRVLLPSKGLTIVDKVHGCQISQGSKGKYIVTESYEEIKEKIKKSLKSKKKSVDSPIILTEEVGSEKPKVINKGKKNNEI